MNRLFAAAIVLAGALAGLPALAQFVPPSPALQNRIPAPLPPPAEPPIINGPLRQAPSPGVINPRRLNTFGDRVKNCLHEGSTYGLRGGKLNAYARSCANAN